MLVYGECECFVMQMFVSCVHPVAVLNASFCIPCSLLMLVEDARSRSHDYLIGNALFVDPTL